MTTNLYISLVHMIGRSTEPHSHIASQVNKIIKTKNYQLVGLSFFLKSVAPYNFYPLYYCLPLPPACLYNLSIPCPVQQLELVRSLSTLVFHHPKLDTRISVLCPSSVTLRGPPPPDSETGWTGGLRSNPVLLIIEN